MVNPSQDLDRIIESARRLGVQLDQEDAIQWLTAMAASPSTNPITVDEASGIFGHRIVMLDFSPKEIARFREIGRLVALDKIPGVVETALALSGSSAQSKIQTYPGDCDFFERVNIRAATREEACRILAKQMREKALATARGPYFQLTEVKFGCYPYSLVHHDQTYSSGSPISWQAEEIQAGEITGTRPDGEQVTVTWEQVSANPGWCKLDWVVVDPVHQTLGNASNMLDVTWEAPDGEINPLDGYLDPYFQEIYLDAEAIPIFSKLVKNVSSDALDRYVNQLEQQVRKELSRSPANYSKAAKRMYNIFRLTGRYADAAFLRELFNEPAVVLYQVWALIRAIDESCQPGSEITVESAIKQADELILSTVKVLEGDEEVDIVKALLHLRDSLTSQQPGEDLTPRAEAARAKVIEIVNHFFYDRLAALPTILEYMQAIVQDDPSPDMK